MKERNKKLENKEQHVVTVETRQTVEDNDNELNNRINRLFGKQEEQVIVKEYDLNELTEVRFG